MKKLSAYIWKYKWKYALAISLLLAAVTLDMFSPRLTQILVDEVLVGKKMKVFWWVMGGFLGIGLVKCVFHYVKEYTFDSTSNKISVEIRRDLFKHIQSLSAGYFDKTNTGELMSRVKDDVDRIWDGLGFVGMLLIEVVYHTIAVLVSISLINVKLMLIPLAAIIICGGVALFMENSLGKIYEEISEENAVLNTVAEENLGGVRTVKSFTREKFEIKKFLSHNKKYYELNMQQSKVFVRYYPMFSVVTKLLPVIMLLAGGYYVVEAETMTLGELSAVVEYSMNIVWPMEMLGWLTNCFSQAVASNNKLKKIYGEQPTVVEAAEPVVPEEIRGKVTFDKVCFRSGEREILSDISFVLEPGKTLGIMGETGSGKTTILKLLQRTYDVTEGQIKLDDVDIRDMSLSQVRRAVAGVSQDVFLFSDTIAENIALGERASITKEEVEEAARKACVAEFAEKMEEGYDTVIGERGVGLSGGQKQRISIARAISKKAPILVLDDSTSALDVETEQEIQKMLRERKESSKIIVAHRISAVRYADEIIVLSGGRIAERGTHEALMAEKGLYFETYLSQYGE